MVTVRAGWPRSHLNLAELLQVGRGAAWTTGWGIKAGAIADAAPAFASTSFQPYKVWPGGFNEAIELVVTIEWIGKDCIIPIDTGIDHNSGGIYRVDRVVAPMINCVPFRVRINLESLRSTSTSDTSVYLIASILEFLLTSSTARLKVTIWPS